MNLVRLIARVLLVMIVISAFLGAMEIATSRTAHADSPPEYTVEADTAAGGVYARYGPHVNDTQRSGGYGVYPNQVVALLCGVTDGDPVGEYQNTTWHFVSDLSNAGEGNFWLSDYYVNTPNLATNQLAPNESTCADESSNPITTPAQQPPPFTTEFFSPWDTIPQAVTGNSAVDNVGLSQWAPGSCSDQDFVTNTVTVQPEGPGASNVLVPSTVTTLAGWSLGRLGPLYFLAGATQAQKDAIHTIILFDPGNTTDFVGDSLDSHQNTCDWRFATSSLYANWLESNPSNKMVIVTGYISEQKVIGYSTYLGLKLYYLADLQNTVVGSNQIWVCDYDSLDHTSALNDFTSLLSVPFTSCPVAPDSSHPLTSWHP